MKICPSCYSVFDGKNWIFESRKNLIYHNTSMFLKEFCPGCSREKNKRIDGVVTIQGKFYRKHKNEVHNLILNIEEKKRKKNIAAKITSFRASSKSLTIETTEKTLAERIGKELEKAYSGALNISWLEGADFVRVDWYRNQ